MMVIADHPRDLPRPILELPKMNEPSFSLIDLRMARVVETVHTGFQCAVSLHRKSLKASRYQLAGRLPANILFHAFRERLSPERHAALVVIELHVVHEK